MAVLLLLCSIVCCCFCGVGDRCWCSCCTCCCLLGVVGDDRVVVFVVRVVWSLLLVGDIVVLSVCVCGVDVGVVLMGISLLL